MPYRPPPLPDRFWAKVRKQTDGCWLWQGRIHNGYGEIKDQRRLLRVHRLSWELHYGPIPAGLCVCHHCDNPPCVRPDHLFLGTNQDNIRDRTAKGRSKNAIEAMRVRRTKLSAAQVRTIRALYATGATTYAMLASQFAVSRDHIRSIVYGKRRQSVGLEDF